MIRRTTAFAALAIALAAPGIAAGCGNDQAMNPNYGSLPEAGFNTGNGGSGSGYGSGSGNTGENSDAALPPCPLADRQCPEPFTFPYHGETSVQVHGDFSSAGWTSIPMTHASGSSNWTATVDIPWNTSFQYGFIVTEEDGGTVWALDPNNTSTETTDAGDVNSLYAATTCTSFLCQQPGPTPPGVFDWRDAVIYFVFVDRFYDGDPSNNCSVSGASSEGTLGTPQYATNNYMGGDWKGVTQQINAGYFNTLGVNTLWISVPIQNGDNYLGAGEYCDNSGNCAPTSYQYSAYAGYWPIDPGAADGGPNVEPCFGTPQDLHDLVTAAHANNLKVLFDYAMVDVLSTGTNSFVTDNSTWFTPQCQCGQSNCGDYNNFTCWFTPYLAHFDFTGSTGAPADARTFSVNGALSLVQAYGNDAFRLDAIKQVDPSWLASLRPQINAYENQIADGGPVQHFYMVGETYDFENTGYIDSFINTSTGLDGQFDFPERYRLVDVMLARDTSDLLAFCSTGPNPPSTSCSWNYTDPPGMQGLAKFMDENDAFYQGYTPGAVMSPFIGNQDLPRSIHFAEDNLPTWLGTAGNGESAIQNAVTYDGEYTWSTTEASNAQWTPEPAYPESDANAYERLANAFAVILTNPGAPLIYYGDEIGLTGAGDPDNRRAMPWPTQPAGSTNWPSAAWTTCAGQGPICQQGLHDRIATLTHIRAAHPALRRGTRTEIFATDPDLWIFSQQTTVGSASDTVYVAINRSDTARTAPAGQGVPAGLTELVVGGTSTGSDTFPPREARIYSNYVAPDAGAGGG
jgi:glycosidase